MCNKYTVKKPHYVYLFLQIFHVNVQEILFQSLFLASYPGSLKYGNIVKICKITEKNKQNFKNN